MKNLVWRTAQKLHEQTNQKRKVKSAEKSLPYAKTEPNN